MPSNYIKLFQNIPLDASYQHTLYFSSRAAQSAYFDGAVGVVKDGLTITRVASNKVRIGGSAEKYRDYNYIMINNSEYEGAKRIYAFISDVEYVNDSCFNVEYEIDVMQTYARDYTLQECFVERNHVSDDTAGAHTVAEPIDSGEYVKCIKESRAGFGQCTQVAILSQYNMSQTPPQQSEGFFYANLLYMPFAMNTYNIGTAAQTSALRDYFKRCEEFMVGNIVDIFQFPTELDDTSAIQEKEIYFDMTTPFGSYTPKNNKLYTYPYCFFTVSNNDGQGAVFKWDDFPSGRGHFNLIGALLPEPSMILIPVNYKGVSEDYDAAITLSNFPHLPWTSSAKQAYLQQNSNQIAMKTVSAGVNAIPAAASGAGSGALVAGVPGAVVGGVLSAGASLFSAYMGEKAKQKDLEAMPAQMHGSMPSEGLKVYMNRYEFRLKEFAITEEYARIVDNFFTRFGYQINRVMVPHTHNRENFCYVKTSGCAIRPLNAPADAAKKICNIFDGGITFWTNPANVGDYSVSNAPI